MDEDSQEDTDRVETPLRIIPGPVEWEDSNSLTQPDPVQDDNAQNSDIEATTSSNNEASNESRDFMWMPNMGDYNDDSNTAQAGNSDAGATVREQAPPVAWRPGLGINDDSSSAFEHSEDSNTGIVNQESVSLAPLPDADTKKDESLYEPPAKVRKRSSPNRNDDLDGETCPICLDTWGNSGDHRLVALKCGHLFGALCVERWLRAQSTKDRSCPTCKSKAAMKDLRFIYARRLVAADTTQITTLQKQIENLQTEKSRTELELQKSRIAYRACALQLEVLRSTLMKSQGTKEQAPRRSWRFALEKNIEISKNSDCRVLTFNNRTCEIYVSQKSNINLFPGYGIRKISCVDYKLGQFVYLHVKPIRDVKYSQPRDLLLSVGLDSAARIVERGIPSMTVQCGQALWSCSWDFLRSHEFYVGGQGGVVHHYDVRNPRTYMHTMNAPGDMSPVVSLCSTEYGLLTCQLNSSWLWVANNGKREPRSLPVDGPFMSLRYDNESHRALLSRRGGVNERSRLTLCRLKASVPSGEILFDVDQTFPGSHRSALMSRSAFVKAPGQTWVAAHSESDSALFLHGLDGARTLSLPAAEPALDVCSTQMNGETLLASLSESRLRLYRAIPTNL